MTQLATYPLYAFGLFFLPGYLAVCATWSESKGIHRVFIGALAGLLLLGFLVIAAAMVTNLPVTLPTLAMMSVTTSALLGWWIQKNDISVRCQMEPGAWPILIATAATGLLYLIHYDRDLFQFNCINRASALVLGIDPFGRTPSSDYLLAGNTNVRLGNVALVAPSFITFNFFGPRLVYAVTGALSMGFGCLVGLRLFRQTHLALITGAAIGLNPYVLAIPIIDENLFAYLLTIVVMLSMLERNTPPAWLGIILGYLVGCRHIGLLVFGGVALWLWTQKPRAKHIGSLLAGFIAVCSLWLFHHTNVFGTPLSFESFQEYHQDYPHSFLGFSFGFRGLMNFPFHETLVRTPYNPYPNMLLMLFWVLNRFGILCVALALVGLRQLHKEIPIRIIAAYCVPLLLVIACLENWMQPNKMGIQLLVLPWLPLAAITGAVAVWKSPKKKGAIVIATGLLLGSGQYLLSTWTAPVDTRVYNLEVPVRTERNEYFQWEKKNLVKHNILPDFSRLSEYSPLAPARKIANVFFDMTKSKTIYPPAQDEQLTADSNSMYLTVDFSKPLITSNNFIRKRQSVNTKRPLLAVPARADTMQSHSLQQSPPHTKSCQIRGCLVQTPTLEWADLKPNILVIPNHDRRFVHVILEFGEHAYLDDFAETVGPPDPIATQAAVFDLEIPKTYKIVVTEVVADHFSKYYRWTIPTQPELSVPDEPTTVFTN